MDQEETLANYEKAGIRGRTGFGKKPCILVIDFQKGFTQSQYPLAGNLDKEVMATVKLLGIARRKKVPAIFTVVAYDGSGVDAARYFEKIPSLKTLVKGTPMVKVDERLSPGPTEAIIEKKYQSAFFGTPLFSLMNIHQIDTTIICGCVTSSCVRSTAVDSMQLGFHTIIPRQCVGDRAPGPHESSLFDLDTKVADVVDLEEVMGYLDKLPLER